MKHMMIDLETTGIRPSSKILSIGASSTESNSGVLQNFYGLISADRWDNNFTTDASTMKWWSEQSADVKKEAFEMPALWLAEAERKKESALQPKKT